MTPEQKLDKIADDITSIKVSIARMEEQLASGQEAHDRAETRLDAHERRLACIENRPGRWWDKLLGAGLGAAVVTLFTWIAEQIKR